MEVKGNGETYTAPSAVALKNRHHVPVDDVLAANYSRQFAVTALASSIAGKESTPFLSEYSQKGFCNDNLENVKFENISTMGDMCINGFDLSAKFENFAESHKFGVENAEYIGDCIESAMNRDGRLYPIDYSLEDREWAFDKECAKHDGYLAVSTSGQYSAVYLPKDQSYNGIMWKTLNEDGLSRKVMYGTSYVWLDSLERQKNMSKEDLPSTKHEHWAENMEAFRIRSKEWIDMIKDQGLETKSVDKAVENAKKEAPAAKAASASMEKSLSAKGNETETKPVDKSNKVKSRSAAGKFHKNQAVIAVWTNDDIVKKADGTVKGAYLDIQIDQSNLSRKDVQNGKGLSSPSVHYAYSQNPERKPNKVFYTARQMDMMQSVGTTTDAGKAHGCSFTANVYTRKGVSGKDTSFVLLPKDEAFAKSNAELDDVRWYNSQNELKAVTA